MRHNQWLYLPSCDTVFNLSKMNSYLILSYLIFYTFISVIPREWCFINKLCHFNCHINTTGSGGFRLFSDSKYLNLLIYSNYIQHQRICSWLREGGISWKICAVAMHELKYGRIVCECVTMEIGKSLLPHLDMFGHSSVVADTAFQRSLTDSSSYYWWCSI